MKNNFNWKEINICKVAMYYGLTDDLDASWVLCPEHETDGLRHSPSCKVYHNDAREKDGVFYEAKDVIVCFGGCTNRKGKRLCLDNFSLVALMEGLDQDDKEDCLGILKILEEIETWDESEVPKGSIKIKDKPNKTKTKSSNMKTYEELYVWSNSIEEEHSENKFFIDDFLNKRGIILSKVKPILDLNGLEFRHKYFNNENYLYLFDKNNKFAISRKIDDFLKKKTYSKQDFKYQNINPVRYSKINGSKDNIILFESFYDLLALYSHLKNPEQFTFISSNSASNKHWIYEREKELLENAKNVFSLFDNDEAGNVATLFFQSKLSNIKDIRYKLDGSKDVCDYIKKNLYIRIKSEDLIDGE